MAKMRIHELRKELGMEDSNKIIDFLKKETGTELKAQSGIEENMVDTVRKHFMTLKPFEPAKTEVSNKISTDNQQEYQNNRLSNPAKPQDKGVGNQGQKSQENHLMNSGQRSQDSRPVNQGQRPQENRPINQGQRQENRPMSQGQRPQENHPISQEQRSQENHPISQEQRSQENHPISQGQRPQENHPISQGQRPQENRPISQGQRQENRPISQGQRPQENRPISQGQRQENRPISQGQRPQEGRPVTSARPQENRQTSPNQGQRTSDGRPMNQGQRSGTGSYGDRRPQENRPAGQGQYGSQRSQTGSYGDRRPQENRPAGQGQYSGQRSQTGSYGDRRPQENRPAGQGQYGGQRSQTGSYGDRRPQENRPAGQGQYGGQRSQTGSYGDRRPQENRPAGQGQYGGQRSQTGSYGGRPQGSGGQGYGAPRTGGYGGQRSGFDKDKDSNYSRGTGDRRGIKPDLKSGEKSTIKTDLANELIKEQRAAAFNDRSRDRNRDRKRDTQVEDGAVKTGKGGKKDPNRKGAFIMPKPQIIQEQKGDEIKTVIIPEILTIKELSDKMKRPASVVVKKLFLEGKMVSINQEITYEEAEEIALSFNYIVEKEVAIDVVEELLKEEEEDETLFEKRPPVVCVMGHVDHGKTSLLDAIRKTNVTSREAGGITQHIGAYVVEVKGEKITFLDTPGHEAFTSMRMRGAKSTDIAILVVAADDGVMPQTVEAISHAKAAGVQIIVAVNKVDKPSANIERVKQELTEYGLVAEDWGGDTIFVPVSAHTSEGIEQLLEMIILTAEMCELRANPNRKARGIVIEAELDKGRGTVATILVQKGTLQVGDSIAIGSAYGKVRAMMDDNGRRVKEATPSTPVEILGLNEVPNAGEIFMATDTEKEARIIAEAYISQGRERLLADTKAKLSLDGLFSQIKAGNIKELNLIIKADVQGSVEAVKQSLVKLSNDEVAVRIIHGGVGAVNESDVMLATTSNAIIIGFNVRPDNMARDIAEREKVDLRLYRVIYNAIEDVEAAMKGMLDPIFAEKIIAHAEVRQIFKASSLGVIAGSYVLDGKIIRGSSARITRGGVLVFEGTLASVKRFKDDVKEVASGYECGLVFEKFNDVRELDIVELYVMEEVPR